MYHFYSVDHDNEMATVSIFMNVYDDAPPYRYLDKIICRWREKEYNTRKQCGLEPIASSYPGCFPLQRERLRKLKTANSTTESNSNHDDDHENNKIVNDPLLRTVADVIYHNQLRDDNYNNQILKINLDEMDLSPAEEKDWDVWIDEKSKKLNKDERLYRMLLEEEYNGVHTDDLHRQLIEGDEEEWYNYWPMLGARTEYYYR